MYIILTWLNPGNGNETIVSPQLTQEEATANAEGINRVLGTEEYVKLPWGAFKGDHIENYRVVAELPA